MSFSCCFLRLVTRKGNFSFVNPLKIMPSLSPSRFSLPLILTWHRFAAVNAQWSSEYCPNKGVAGVGRMGIDGSVSFGNGRRGGGNGEFISIGGVLEIGGGYDFSADDFYGEFTAAGSVGVNVYLPGSGKRKGYSFNRDFELTCPFGGKCTFEY